MIPRDHHPKTLFPFPRDSKPSQSGSYPNGLPYPQRPVCTSSQSRRRLSLPWEIPGTTGELSHRALFGFMPTLILATYPLSQVPQNMLPALLREGAWGRHRPYAFSQHPVTGKNAGMGHTAERRGLCSWRCYELNVYVPPKLIR